MLSKVRKSSLRSENHDEYKKNLVAELKKNVKSLMELLAYRKLVNEDSGVVYQLCLAVEACVKHGLKRRTFESFSSNDTYYVDLLSRLDQLGCASAAFVSSRIRTLKSKPSPSATSPVVKMFSFSSSRAELGGDTPPVRESLRSTWSSQGKDQFSERVLWIRIALVEKHLLQILSSLVTNASTLYQQHALLADPVSGPLIPALLAGPCSIDYSHLRGSDIPPYGENTIDDVLNRRKMSSSSAQAQNKQQPRQNLLTRARHFSIAAGDILQTNRGPENATSPSCGELEYMFTAASMNLPGNRAPELVYAKNNIAMEPYSGSAPVLGYLAVCVPSAAKTEDGNSGAVIRWTPNNIFHSSSSSDSSPMLTKRVPSVVFIRLCEVSHIHCHTRPHSDSNATIVFIGQDGVQFPAMMFKEAASALSFLQALTAAVPSNTRLEPPLSAAAFDVDTESRDLVFQLVPTTPKLLSEPSLSKVPEDAASTIGEDDSQAAGEDENKVPPLEGFKKVTRGLRESKTDVDLHASASGDDETPGRLPSSKSVTSGMSANLEAALSAVTMAGAQFFNEIEHMDSTLNLNQQQNTDDQQHQRAPRGVTRLSFVCRSVQRQLLARAFYGWLAYVRHVKTVRTQLAALVLSSNDGSEDLPKSFDLDESLVSLTCATSLDRDTFARLHRFSHTKPEMALRFCHRLIYNAGVSDLLLRPRVWAVLLGVTTLGSSDEEVKETWLRNAVAYTTLCLEWQTAEQQAEALAATRQLVSSEAFTPAAASASSAALPTAPPPTTTAPATAEENVFPEDANKKRAKIVFTFSNALAVDNPPPTHSLPPKLHEHDLNTCKLQLKLKDKSGLRRSFSAVFIDVPVSTDLFHHDDTHRTTGVEVKRRLSESGAVVTILNDCEHFIRSNGCVKTGIAATKSEPAPSSLTPTVTVDDPRMALLSSWLTNLHRIDKDVARCDRSLEFFRPCNPENLIALRRIVCSYVWQHMDVGYIQGMCDLAAPFLVVCKESKEEEPEALAFTLFSKLMDRIGVNFPTGATSSTSGPAAIDIALSRLRSLIQILDPELYEHLSDAPSELDATHLYFAYRWLLLDFKREFVYADVFRIWETIWAADDVASPAFSLFVAFALIETYRDVIVSENMDFTDIIKFFNDMAERHDVDRVLDLARQLVRRVQETSLSSGHLSPAVIISIP